MHHLHFASALQSADLPQSNIYHLSHLIFFCIYVVSSFFALTFNFFVSTETFIQYECNYYRRKGHRPVKCLKYFYVITFCLYSFLINTPYYVVDLFVTKPETRFSLWKRNILISTLIWLWFKSVLEKILLSTSKWRIRLLRRYVNIMI